MHQVNLAEIKRISAILFIFLSCLNFSGSSFRDEAVVDSNMTFNESVAGLKFPSSIRKKLILITVQYYSFDGKLHWGQILMDRALESEVIDIFGYLKTIKFPVNKVVPICQYNWSDSLSIMDNNTSGFNYRYVEGTKVLSKHSSGRAIDLNPYLNPQIKPGIKSQRIYNTNEPGTLFRKSPVVEYFLKKGWQWGGSWKSLKDYQHFQK